MTSPNPTVSSRAQSIAPALVVLLSLVALSAVVDMVLMNLPLQMDDPRWRFAAFGRLLTSAPQFTLLLAVISAIGLLGGERRPVRTSAAIMIVLGAVVVLLAPFLGLDWLTVRRQVNVDARRNFDLTAAKTLVFGLLMVPFLIWAGIRGLKATAMPKGADRQKEKGEGLIVGQ